MRIPDRRLLVAAPSLVLLALTAVAWRLWPPPATEPTLATVGLLAVGAALGLALGLAAVVLERTSASFRSAGMRLERAVRALRLGPGSALGLALLTGVSEELFFRGWLLHVLGPWGQAVVFMLLHPAGRAGWVYTLFTGVAGLAFGALTLVTGSLLPALVAHVGINLHGFLSGRRRRTR